MEKNWIVEVYTDRYRRWMNKYGFVYDKARYGSRYKATVTKAEKNAIARRAFFYSIKMRCYEKKWERSSNYRANFFDEYKPPYYCRYCGRKLRTSDVQVDHLVPVNAVKNHRGIWLLSLQGIDNVNDVRNLVPSCAKCNRLKSDKLGLWYVRGVLGKYKPYWIMIRVSEALLALAVIVLVVYAIATQWA